MDSTTVTDRVPLGACFDLEDILMRSGLARFASGAHAVASEIELSGVEQVDSLVPLSSIRRRFVARSRQSLLAEGDGWLITILCYSSTDTTATITAEDDEKLDKAVAMLEARAPEPTATDGSVSTQLWFCSDGATCRTTQLEAPEWGSIRSNYPAPVRSSIEQLMAHRPISGDGKLLLWHGPPGTGKTTAIRALIREWEPWCKPAVITDPDQLFSNTSYLMDVLTRGTVALDSDPESGDRWRLLIVEDADELLRVEAKREVGQALSRLLNITDGFIGQGLRVLVLLSTNEDVAMLHPAVARPGRCLSQIHFDRFDRRSAKAWLEADLPAGSTFSLAELFHIRSGADSAPSADRTLPDQYL